MRGELKEEFLTMKVIDIMREATFRVPGDMVVTETPLEDPNIIGFSPKSFVGVLAAKALHRIGPTLIESESVGMGQRGNNSNVLDTNIGGSVDGK